MLDLEALFLAHPALIVFAHGFGGELVIGQRPQSMLVTRRCHDSFQSEAGVCYMDIFVMTDMRDSQFCCDQSRGA